MAWKEHFYAAVAEYVIKHGGTNKTIRDEDENTEVEPGFLGSTSRRIRGGWHVEYIPADVAEILGVSQHHEESGYCETCYDSWDEVVVRYRDSKNEVKTYNFYGDMEQFMRELTTEEE